MMELRIVAFVLVFNSSFLLGSYELREKKRGFQESKSIESEPETKRICKRGDSRRFQGAVLIPPVPITYQDRNKERIEDLAIRLIHEHAISEFAFNHYLSSPWRKNYKDDQGHSWWDHAKAANNHVIMKVLQENNLIP